MRDQAGAGEITAQRRFDAQRGGFVAAIPVQLRGASLAPPVRATSPPPGHAPAPAASRARAGWHPAGAAIHAATSSWRHPAPIRPLPGTPDEYRHHGACGMDGGEHAGLSARRRSWRNQTMAVVMNMIRSARRSGFRNPRTDQRPGIVTCLIPREARLIAAFSRTTTPLGGGLLRNPATKARPISSCSIAPNGPGIRRPSQAT